MDLSNLHTTLRAHQKLSPSILEKYAKLTDLDEVKNTLDKNLSDYKQEVADSYVPEVEDRESDKIYARNGKERSWKELKRDTMAKPILIRFGYNLDEQMDIIDVDPDSASVTIENNVAELNGHTTLDPNATSYDLICEIPEGEEGYLWICVTQPLKAIQWMGYLWGDYYKQKDVVTDPKSGESYYCYRSNEILIDNLWQFKLLF